MKESNKKEWRGVQDSEIEKKRGKATGVPRGEEKVGEGEKMKLRRIKTTFEEPNGGPVWIVFSCFDQINQRHTSCCFFFSFPSIHRNSISIYLLTHSKPSLWSLLPLFNPLNLSVWASSHLWPHTKFSPLPCPAQTPTSLSVALVPVVATNIEFKSLMMQQTMPMSILTAVEITVCNSRRKNTPTQYNATSIELG